MKTIALNPKYNKPLIVAGSIVVCIVAIVVARRLIFGKTDNSGSKHDPTGNGNSAPIDADEIAQGLYEAMRGIGTDEEAINALLAPINEAQFREVVTAFDNKKYNTTTGTDKEYFVTLDKYGLKDWLKFELSDSEYELLQKKFPNELK